MIILVETGIPIPNWRDADTRTNTPLDVLAGELPFSQMQVGDSLYLPGSAGALPVLRAFLTRHRLQYQKRNPGTKFKTRTQDGGLRTWRVA
jgi:hypothetical protein